MAATTSANPELAYAKEKSTQIPWYLWCAALAVTSVTIGAHWDVSWHRSIGRDTFWTPAHMAIYACGVLAGICCGYLILNTTFRRSPEFVAASVNVYGFRAPLGAFLAAWGGSAMLTSAPFDNWWHNAYGLDVKIISPPHTLLMLGIFAVEIGTLFLITAAMNRSDGALLRSSSTFCFILVGSCWCSPCSSAWKTRGTSSCIPPARTLLPRLVCPLTLRFSGKARATAGPQRTSASSMCSSVSDSFLSCRSFPLSRNSGRSISRCTSSFRRSSRCC